MRRAGSDTSVEYEAERDVPESRSAAAIGKRLRALRHERQLTLHELRAATQLSTPYLSRIERGETLPRPETLQVIGSALEVADDVLRPLLEDLSFGRECAALERLGYDPDVAELTAMLSRLDAGTREAVVGRWTRLLDGVARVQTLAHRRA
jgi:transcriptional regulator with XRE-family HTH domain